MPSTDNNISLETLPLDIQLQILASVPSLRTLHSLLMSTPIFTHIFRKFDRIILPGVVRASKSDPLQRIIHVVAYIRRHGGPAAAEVEDFLHLHLGKHIEGHPTAVDLRLCDPIARLVDLVGLDEIVESHVESFLHARLAEPPLVNFHSNNNCEEQEAEATRTETHRVRRSFWLLQLYCSLFHVHLQFEPDLRKMTQRLSISHAQMQGPRAFFGYLSLWEIEDLECIWQYLQKTPSPIPRENVGTSDQAAGEEKERNAEEGAIAEGSEKQRGSLLALPVIKSKGENGQLQPPGLYFSFALSRFRNSNDGVQRIRAANIACPDPLPFRGQSDGHNCDMDVASAGFRVMVQVRQKQASGFGGDWNMCLKYLLYCGYTMWDETRLKRWGLSSELKPSYIAKRLVRCRRQRRG